MCNHFGRFHLEITATIAAMVLFSSCATPPQYDSTTDAAISNAQKEIDSQLVKWISADWAGDAASLDKASFDANRDFYSKVDVDLTALSFSMEAVADKSTAKLPQFFENLRTQIDNLRNDHLKNIHLKAETLQIVRNQLNAQFAVLLTYELSLKGVNSPSSATTQSTATATAAVKTPAPK